MTWTLAEQVRRLARQNTLCHFVFIHPSLTLCKQIRIPESGKYLLVESRIPSSTDTESWIHNVESIIQDCLGLPYMERLVRWKGVIFSRFSGEQRKTWGDQFTNITFQKLISMCIFIQTKSHLFQTMFNPG